MSLHLQRLNSEMLKALSEAIRELKDPRLSMLTTVMSVDLSKDLMYSKVYISILDDQEKKEQTLKILNNASGEIAKRVNSKVKMRRVPKLDFVMDNSMEYSDHINTLLHKVMKKQDDE